ncbi:MAG: hypothetical protein ACNA78_08070, partial [Balneolaceae bacterium]
MYEMPILLVLTTQCYLGAVVLELRTVPFLQSHQKKVFRMALMVSVSGIRGVIGSHLHPENLVHYAAAFGTVCDGG